MNVSGNSKFPDSICDFLGMWCRDMGTESFKAAQCTERSPLLLFLQVSYKCTG